MGAWRWTLNHGAHRSEVIDLVTGMGFEKIEDNPGIWVKKVSSGSFWREMKIRVRAHEVIVFVYKEEDQVTENYFEYLMEVGFISGKLASRIEMLEIVGAHGVRTVIRTQRSEPFQDPDDEYYDEEDDDLELEGN